LAGDWPAIQGRHSGSAPREGAGTGTRAGAPRCLAGTLVKHRGLSPGVALGLAPGEALAVHWGWRWETHLVAPRERCSAVLRTTLGWHLGEALGLWHQGSGTGDELGLALGKWGCRLEMHLGWHQELHPGMALGLAPGEAFGLAPERRLEAQLGSAWDGN
jgi:hypothetical protein